MFAEIFMHSEEKIFLEAIDQYFENELIDDINPGNKPIFIKNDNLKQMQKKRNPKQINKKKMILKL